MSRRRPKRCVAARISSASAATNSSADRKRDHRGQSAAGGGTETRRRSSAPCVATSSSSPRSRPRSTSICAKRPRRIPILASLAETPKSLRPRGDNFLAQLADLPVAARLVESKGRDRRRCAAALGPAFACAEFEAKGCSPNELSRSAPQHRPPIVGYVANGAFHLDLRTIFPREDAVVVNALRRTFTDC